MTAVTSAGILLYRRAPHLEVFVAHMGGPFWAKKDGAAWSIPKGLVESGEEPLAAAIREFGEEIGTPVPELDFVLLGEFAQSSHKNVIVFTAESDFELDQIASNLFEMEWPPKSGRIQQYPEMDDARWMSIEDARIRLVRGQVPVLAALAAHVGG